MKNIFCRQVRVQPTLGKLQPNCSCSHPTLLWIPEVLFLPVRNYSPKRSQSNCKQKSSQLNRAYWSTSSRQPSTSESMGFMHSWMKDNRILQLPAVSLFMSRDPCRTLPPGRGIRKKTSCLMIKLVGWWNHLGDFVPVMYLVWTCAISFLCPNWPFFWNLQLQRFDREDHQRVACKQVPQAFLVSNPMWNPEGLCSQKVWGIFCFQIIVPTWYHPAEHPCTLELVSSFGRFPSLEANL